MWLHHLEVITVDPSGCKARDVFLYVFITVYANAQHIGNGLWLLCYLFFSVRQFISVIDCFLCIATILQSTVLSFNPVCGDAMLG